MFRFFCCCSKNAEKEEKKDAPQKREEQLTEPQKLEAYEIFEQRLRHSSAYAVQQAKKHFAEMDPYAQVTVAHKIGNAKRINELPIEIAKEVTVIKNSMPLQRQRANCRTS